MTEVTDDLWSVVGNGSTPITVVLGIQASGHHNLIDESRGLGLDGVLDDQAGAGAAGLGAVQGLTTLGGGLCFSFGGQRVQGDGQDAWLGGVYVTGLVEDLAHECFAEAFGSRCGSIR